MQKPLIAAVNGAAIGVGTTMLMHCDLIVAARSARFVMPFTSLGLVPEAASSLLFPRLLGYQRASALLLLGEPLDADDGVAVGLREPRGGRCGADGDGARDGAATGALPPQAVRLTKRLIRHGAPDVAARMEEELALFRERLGSPEANGGVRRVHGEAQTGLLAVRLKRHSPQRHEDTKSLRAFVSLW